MDFFPIGLGLACLSFVLGLAWRVHGRPGSRLPRPSAGHGRGIRGLAAGLADMILLRRTLRGGKLRWAGHTLLLLGFLPLLFLHAMDGIVTRPLFSGYEPTLEPWQSARNILGLAALAGLGLLAWHRGRRLLPLSRFQDWALLGLLSSILLTGFLLEAAKMASPADFERMVADYFPEADGEELVALQAHWARENGVRFERFLPTAPEILERGRELHEDRCAGCHAPTATAFASRALADALPSSTVLPRTMPRIFWHLHVGLSFLALALLPWGKFLHPLASSANLLTRGGRRDSGFPATALGRNLALEACIRCGQCSLHCSVAPSRRVLGNADILPMDKLADLRGWLDRSLDTERLADLVEGSHICTECLRCTQVCPAGIDLQDLWMSSKAALSEEGRAGVDGEIRKRTAGEWARELGSRRLGGVGSSGTGLADRAESFWGCVQCTTCTGVCPVVAVSTDPQRDLDLTPQQIMNFLRMGLKAQTLGARMVWSCTTCYKCQEHCPQGVPVADILYELRQLGAGTLRHKGKP
jgi:heterodisulfide reductase subunit C/nitrate reductase gamma subunit